MNDAPVALFEILATHAVEAPKGQWLREGGIPCVELRASELIDPQTGENRWDFEKAPLPLPERKWHLEREETGFALCEACRATPTMAARLQKVAAEIEDAEELKRLHKGLAFANEPPLQAMTIGETIEAWRRPEPLDFSVGRQLARVGPTNLIDAATARRIEMLEDPFGAVFKVARGGTVVPKDDLGEAEGIWTNLVPSARDRHSEKRRQTYVLDHVARQAKRGNTAVAVESLVAVVRRIAPQEVNDFRSRLARLSPSTTPLAVVGKYAGFSDYVRAEADIMAAVTRRLARPSLRPELATSKDEQERAVSIAFARPFSMITGGPGTGKTTAAGRLFWAIAHERAQLPWALSKNDPGLLSRNDPSGAARSAAVVKVAPAT